MNKKTWSQGKDANIIDPRLVIARHIGWIRPATTETTYTVPEPDDYNYAVLSTKPRPCSFIKNQVFYKDPRSKQWWSVYYVLDTQATEFLTWAESTDFDFYWRSYHRTTKTRTQRKILHFRTNSAEQTPEERLYNMGYYHQLQTEFNFDLSERLGPPRAKIAMPLDDYVEDTDYTEV